MKIEVDDLSRPAIHALLNEHLQSMYATSPPESIHALDLQRLSSPEVTFWSAWQGSTLVGIGALKELSRTRGEIKSMRTPNALRRLGAGRAILAHIIATAQSRGYERLSLETGSMSAFKPARALYESFGFAFCGPFGQYTEDPNSVFMTKLLKKQNAEVTRVVAVLRQASRDDIAAMHRVRLAVRENRLTSSAIREEHYVPEIEVTGRGWIVVEEGEVVAFAVGNKSTRNIWALFVEPGHEHRGHGRSLLDVTVDWLFAQGLPYIWLSTAPKTRAQRFYEVAGWSFRRILPSGEYYYELRRP